jgi:very-short-patch-repair endonuclease
LIVELDGSQHMEQAEHDERRTQWLNERGYRVVRFWNFQVFTEWESVEEEIYRQLTAGQQNPPP